MEKNWQSIAGNTGSGILNVIGRIKLSTRLYAAAF
jgi:hypothetical protein